MLQDGQLLAVMHGNQLLLLTAKHGILEEIFGKFMPKELLKLPIEMSK
jgi:hypothetical protein